MTRYLDASAVVDLLLGPTSEDLWKAEEEAGCSSVLMPVEVRRTLLRLQRERRVSAATLARALGDLVTLEKVLVLHRMSATVLHGAGQAFPVHVRTLDAIHLATALEFREQRFPDLIVATYDRRLGIAAAALGFDIAGVTP